MNEQVSALALENAEHFRGHRGFNGKGLYFGFKTMARHCEDVGSSLERLSKEAPKYDIDARTAGNGFRSFLSVYDACLIKCMHLCEIVKEKRSSKFFFIHKAKYRRDLDDWNEVLATLRSILNHVMTLLEWNGQDGANSLFPSGKRPMAQLMAEVQSIESRCFYGRLGGFQLCKSAASDLGKMLSTLAAFSEYYFGQGTNKQRVARAFWMGLKYFMNADRRAERIVAVTPLSSIDFCKSFWALSDTGIMKAIVRLACPSVEVNQLIHIDPEPLQVKLADGKVVHVPPPSAHGPAAPIQIRLLSAKRRPGMALSSKRSESKVPLSDTLIIHCHGGAFVALNSQNYECYLRHWAVCLDAPIVCVDYSLAPEFPFPRSLQELIYVYAWALINPTVFGTTAKKIVLFGDSAGGNLAIAVSMLTSYLNLPKPTGVLSIYAPLVVHSIPSPSRLLLLTDMLLPCQFVPLCQQAYVGHLGIPDTFIEADKKIMERICSTALSMGVPIKNGVWVPDSDIFRNANSPLLSPTFASDVTLRTLAPVRLVCVEMDFCLDESVEFAKRCRRLGLDVLIDVLPDLPHGFLNFALGNSDAAEGSLLCIRRIQELLEL